MFKSRRRSESDDELAQLRTSVQNRGQAKIPEANSYVDTYLQRIATEAGTNTPSAMRWLRDRLRFFLVVGLSSWFGILDRIPEGHELRGEWVALARGVDRFGPEHLVAWWWLVNEELFRPAVEAQLGEMRGALLDGAKELAQDEKGFEQSMVNWGELLAPGGLLG